MNEEERERLRSGSFKKENGFHFFMENRSGTLFYVEEGKVCKMDVDETWVCLDTLTEWISPEQKLMTAQEIESIKQKLKKWISEDQSYLEI